MEIHSIGYHHMHDKNFVIDRPDGIGESWLFLLFHAPVMVRTDGELRRIPGGSVLIYSGDTPEYYQACGDDYMDDWFHFTVQPRDLVLFRELALPINCPVQLANAAECSDLIRTMTYEFHSSKLYHTDVVTLYLHLLLIQISRQVQEPLLQSGQKGSDKYDRLVVLRWHIRHHPEQITSVQALADSYSMSLSSLQHSYKALFGESITHDITQVRMEKAKVLLSTTALPLRQIAEQCGYHSEFHFMRQFREHHGMTPTEYRNFCK